MPAPLLGSPWLPPQHSQVPTPARKLATQRIYCAPQRAVGEGRLLFTLAFRNRQPGVVALSLILYLPLGFSVSGYSHNKLFARNSSFFLGML